MKLIFKKNEKAITNPHRHTLTVSYGSSVTPLTEDYAAPFRYLQEGAYILNLHVDGHIYTSNKFASGIAGNSQSTTVSTKKWTPTLRGQY